MSPEDILIHSTPLKEQLMTLEQQHSIINVIQVLEALAMVLKDKSVVQVLKEQANKLRGALKEDAND